MHDDDPKPEVPAPEFSRPVDVSRLALKELVRAIAADEAERAALAERFDLLSLDRFEAEVQLGRLPGGFVRLTAVFCADLVQACVVTLEPIASRVEERFSLLYGATDDAREVVVDQDSETVEPLAGDTIDIGEAVAQQLSLALNPFPRAPGVGNDERAASTAEEAESPFAALEKWRNAGKTGE